MTTKLVSALLSKPTSNIADNYDARSNSEIEDIMMKRLILVLGLIATASLALTGCQTAEGFGEDMEDAGEKIQEEVN